MSKASKMVTCKRCGTEIAASAKVCPKCGGKGQIVFTSQSFFGTVRNVQTCPDCGGSGKIIKERTIKELNNIAENLKELKEKKRKI